MSNLTAEESIAAVTQLGDTIIATRAALSNARAAAAEALRIAAPLAEENVALKTQVASLEASVAAFDKADADLDAVIAGQLDRVKEADAPPVTETPVTGEAGTHVPGPEVDPATAEVQ